MEMSFQAANLPSHAVGFLDMGWAPLNLQCHIKPVLLGVTQRSIVSTLTIFPRCPLATVYCTYIQTEEWNIKLFIYFYDVNRPCIPCRFVIRIMSKILSYKSLEIFRRFICVGVHCSSASHFVAT